MHFSPVFGFLVMGCKYRDRLAGCTPGKQSGKHSETIHVGDHFLNPHAVDLPNLEVTVFKNGNNISSGKGSAVQGNPLTAVAWLANTLGEFGIPFKAGEVILSGSLVPLEPVVPGDEMHMELSGVGSATITFR